MKPKPRGGAVPPVPASTSTYAKRFGKRWETRESGMPTVHVRLPFAAPLPHITRLGDALRQGVAGFK
jgi:hypothetical protein